MRPQIQTEAPAVYVYLYASPINIEKLFLIQHSLDPCAFLAKIQSNQSWLKKKKRKKEKKKLADYHYYLLF